LATGPTSIRRLRERQGPDLFGFAILTAEPDALRAIDPDVEIEELPAP
jgi:hypothetical protein